MRIQTFTPIQIGYRIAVGVIPASREFSELHSHLCDLDGPELTLVGKGTDRSDLYTTISEDGFDLRIAVFAPAPGASATSIRFHIFGSGVAIAEVILTEPPTPLEALEHWSQKQTREIIQRHLDGFRHCLELIARLTPKDLKDEAAPSDSIICLGHTSRALILSDAERRRPALAPLIQQWLAETTRPEHADEILAGTRQSSMFWLNYLIIEDETETGREETRFLLNTMRIAQYFWSAQDWTNERTREIVTASLTSKKLRAAEKDLLAARARTQMLQVEYESLRAVMNRRREREIRSILEAWSFDSLNTTGDQLVQLSTGKIREISAARTRRSEFVTGLILFGIGAVAVIEAIFSAISFSREVMLRPALEYTDSGGSVLLRLIALADSDAMIGSGLFIIIALTLIYVFHQKK